MKKTILLAAAAMLLTGTGAFAQAAMSPAPATKNTPSAMPKADTQDMKADTNADTAAKPKARHHRMAKNEAALNAKEAETTKQLNQEQSQMASNNRSGMSSPNASSMDSSTPPASGMSEDPNRPNTNSDNPAP